MSVSMPLAVYHADETAAARLRVHAEDHAPLPGLLTPECLAVLRAEARRPEHIARRPSGCAAY